MEIEVTVRNVYGNELIYPVNDAAKTLAEIAGTKTLKPDTLSLARKLGHMVVEVSQNRVHLLQAQAAFKQDPTPRLATAMKQLHNAIRQEER